MTMQRVSKANPCPVCGNPDWCLITEDGSTVICQLIQEGANNSDNRPGSAPESQNSAGGTL